MNNIQHLFRQTGLMALFAFLFPFTLSAQQSTDLQPPSFPGGEEALRHYLSENLQYPGGAMEKGIEGEVVVYFSVEKNGTLKNISLAQSMEPTLDAEALRLVQGMPRWIPALKKGKKTKGEVNLPISFRLSSDNRFMVFEGIPFGSRYDVFDQKLANAGFEVKGNFIQHNDGQTEMRSFDGQINRVLWKLYYAVSDRSQHVYFVGGHTADSYSPQEAQQVFNSMKDYFVKKYGRGYYTNETSFIDYKVTTPLGEVQLSIMRGDNDNGYAVHLKITDAKTYAEAYREAVVPMNFNVAPRAIVDGKAEMTIHTGFVLLGDKLLNAASIDEARQLLEDAEYTIDSATPTTLNAQFILDDYKCNLAMTRKDVTTTVTITASPEIAKVVNDDIEFGILYKQAASKKGQRLYTRGINTLTRTSSSLNAETLVFKRVIPKQRPRRKK
ncbi:MAG: energy transducer TonB [Prevotella sp.]|nr:energy transducer TonB [Prevotella sp.]